MLIQKIFIASPGDVCDERNLAGQMIDRIRGERLFRGKVSWEVIAWDQPSVEVPMDVAMTPQKAIESGLPKPSECDIVIVLLWSRIGTLLPPEYTKPNGERYLSGTEWEFCDALAAAKDKLVTRKTYARTGGVTGLRPSPLPQRRTYGFPHPAVGTNGLHHSGFSPCQHTSLF